MSVEQAKAFIERMTADDAFREKVLAIEDLAERLTCIHGEGFECTQQEILEAGGVLEDVSAGWFFPSDSCSYGIDKCL